MLQKIISLLVTAAAVLITAYILPGVTVKNYAHAIWVAILLALANLLIKPILQILTLPLTILTFGLFLWVINAIIILLVSAVMPSFKVKSFGWALLFSLFLSLVNTVLQWIF
mgnify:FL=1